MEEYFSFLGLKSFSRISKEKNTGCDYFWGRISTFLFLASKKKRLFQNTGCDNFCNAAAGDQARDLPDADEGWGGGEGDGQQL